MRSLAITIISVVLLQLSCKDKGTEPPLPLKNPREYTWTIDTLAYPGSFQTAMRDIWGSSPTDVYVVGHNDRGFGKMFHYDGKEWKPVGLNYPIEGGAIEGPIDLSAIYGFSKNDIWAVGKRIDINPNPPPHFLDSSLIIHFDGKQWRDQTILRGRSLWSISGSAPNDIWTCGTDGTLYHFDGNTWRRGSVVVSVPTDGSFLLWDIQAKSPSEVYMIGNVTQNALARITTFFLMRKNGEWSLVDSFFTEPGRIAVKFGQNGLWVSPEGTLYSFGPHIFRWTGSSWVKVYETLDALKKMAGTSERNMFAVGILGKILHYNGIDWYEFKELRNPNAVYSSVWTDGKEVFVAGFFNDGSKTLILHGR